MKIVVYGTIYHDFTLEIEAENEDEAMDIANDMTLAEINEKGDFSNPEIHIDSALEKDW